jgi:hypothetical protein
MTYVDKRPDCTADAPAPNGSKSYYRGQQWSFGFKHPDAEGECINDDHDDWLYKCPHCKCIMIYEGPDA